MCLKDRENVRRIRVKTQKVEGEEEEGQHAVVLMMTSKCCTGVKPHSEGERARAFLVSAENNKSAIQTEIIRLH